jgi:hypothetical protein
VSMAVAAAVVPGGRRDVGAEKAVAAVAAEAEVIVAPLPPVTSPILTPLPTPVVAAAVPTPPPSPRQAVTVATAQPQQRAVHHNHVVPINLRVSSPMAASVAASAGLTSSSSPAAAAGSRTLESSPPLPSSGGSSPRGGSTSPRPSATPHTSSSSSGNSAFDIIAALNRAWQSSSNRGSTPSASGRSPTPPNLPSIMPSPSLAGKVGWDHAALHWCVLDVPTSRACITHTLPLWGVASPQIVPVPYSVMLSVHEACHLSVSMSYVV